MKEKIKEFLKRNNFLPVNKWSYFEIIHNKPKNKTQKKNTLTTIRNNVFGKNGLYIYEKNRKIIYIGKGNPLFNRMKNHYVSSFEPVKGDTRDKRFHRFFSSRNNLGKIKIYWKEQKEEKVRQILEKMMDLTLDSRFNYFQ